MASFSTVGSEQDWFKTSELGISADHAHDLLYSKRTTPLSVGYKVDSKDFCKRLAKAYHMECFV